MRILNSLFSNVYKRSVRSFSHVTQKAHDFTAQGVNKNNEIINVQLSSYIGKKYCCLFFYPLNYTFVCPTEVIEFNKHVKSFEEKNVELLGISVDSVYSHMAWKNMPIEKGGIGNINFTLVSDINKEISKNYNVLYDNSFALRGLFIIDLEGKIRHKTVNDLSIGRNVNEVLRVIDSIIHVDTSGNVCPINWKKGDKSFRPNNEALLDYLNTEYKK
ncbi:thioredoxin peroxidase 2, putative [Plasmodium berghei]|uniref:Thioredoxin peroxidase 2, putative n=2 Tax=Plasmodium berghei TaxID=5821 RepID=A0A509ARN0_PLABA|nr:thioredoxin peroxidase 2, putative [Plasmodium berghei ANKA]CXJ19567.1 thioredoxin peroxidase 2, putative [Plasmodium berghei]SCM26493.1 thioredoxin peroxidase 2, putative [Plasmodium berghei]SCN28486.1 thioredoxin peroxidase 2, putative [Plasmodium berghei]SCO62676.1 thioredoxin peroxidase 2, putative [Plasmodium berghei]SCO64237.1 thioredoxin peroxidase 2, putative [Plasmodium berghei]|eukprot:XP_034424132.1 thioredoxin peroxidase 2, putative [Plasmodium berghei ANKA]